MTTKILDAPHTTEPAVESRLARFAPWHAAALAGAVAIVGAWPRLLWAVPGSDEGVVGSYAQMIAHGAAPYRDFPLGWNPPEFWIVAGLFRGLGTDYMWLRLSTVLAIALAAALLAVAGSRVLRPPVAAVLAGFWGVVAAIHPDVAGYHFWEMASAAGAALCLLKAVDTEHRHWLLASAAFGALCYWFVQPSGLVLPALGVAALLAGIRFRSLLLWGTAGVLSVSLPILAGLWLTGALPSWAGQTFWSMFSHYSAANGLPIPWWPFNRYFEDSGITWDVWFFGYPLTFVYWAVDFLMPLALMPVTALASLRRLRIPTPLLVLCWVTEAQFAGALIARRDGRMMWLASGVALIAAAALLRLHFPWHRPLLRRVTADLLVVVCFAVAFGPAAIAVRLGCELPLGGLASLRTSAGRICADPESAGTYRHAAAIAEQHPGDAVAYLNETAGLYVLTNRPSPIAYPFLLPGYTTPEQYSDAERQLLAKHVRWVMYIPAYYGRETPQFEDFLARHYSVTSVYRDVPGSPPAVVYRLRD